MNTSTLQFAKVLVATDFTPPARAALDTALALVRGNAAEISVVHAVKHVYNTLQLVNHSDEWRSISSALADGERLLIDRARQELQTLVAPYEGAGIKIHGQVLVGSPFVEIIHAVQLDRYDLVVVGTRGQGALKRAIVGSTATKLARKCPCPLWIARTWDSDVLRSILVPIDFSEVSQRSLAVAASLAESWSATLHLLHVYDSADLSGVPLLPKETQAELSSYRRRVRRAALDQLQDMSDTLSNRPGKVAVSAAPGIAWQVIRATARRINADLIVMGSVGRGGIPGLLIGNTAEKVLHNTAVPLLIVKPDDFVSPVPPPPSLEWSRPQLEELVSTST
jgi:nucleotide-binding universal stress UspA family protein